MVDKYKNILEIVKNKLESIKFYLEENNEYNAIFGNGTSWKIELLGERYMGFAYDLFIRKIDTPNKEFCIRFLFDILGLQNNLPIEEDLNLLIENKDKIFDETFPY